MVEHANGVVNACSSADDGSALVDTKRPFRWSGRNIATMVLAFVVRKAGKHMPV